MSPELFRGEDDRPPSVSVVFRLLGILFLIAAITFTRIFLTPYIGQFFGMFIFFYAGVVILAWIGGFWTGLIASVASTAAIVSFFVVPSATASLSNPWDLLVLVLFFAGSIALSWLGEIRLRHIRLLEGIERKRDEFVKIASHELRAPLATVKLDIDLLRRAKPHGDEEAAALFAEIGQEIVRMEHLIGDMLDVLKIEQGTFTYRDEEFLIEDAVREAVRACEKISRPDIEIEVEGAIRAPMFGDKEKIVQVCTNVLSNAVKYSPHDQRITVELREAAAAAELAIIDRGIGIAPEQAHSIFDPFFRAAEVRGNRRYQGLGLGLYIAKKIVDHYRGTIAITSKPGEGTRVVIRLPLQAPTTSPAHAAHERRGPAPGRA